MTSRTFIAKAWSGKYEYNVVMKALAQRNTASAT